MPWQIRHVGAKEECSVRSYALAIAFSVLLSAVYAFQNPGDITVRFLLWSREVPQGIWEAAVFAAGCVLMWIVSLSAHLEIRGKYRHQIKEQETKIKKLEDERLAFLRTAAKDHETPVRASVEPEPIPIVETEPITTYEPSANGEHVLATDEDILS
ncbi:MAG TPA: DUF1049 domain-containing protein [Synergistaceae bacterium]|nr:DUF1049 domain-containing protein [Synergistaceae bacterium]